MSSAPSPITSRPRETEFTNRFVQPPSAFYVDRDDLLFIRAASSVAGTIFRIGARILAAQDGTVRRWQQDLAPTVDRTPVQNGFPLLEGALLGINVHLEAGASGDSWNYATVGLAQGLEPIALSFHQLARGYLSETAPLIWPWGDYREPMQGRGITLFNNVMAPVVGTDHLFTVPAFARQSLRTARLELVTSATVANRRVIFQVADDVGSVIFESASDFVQAASLTIFYQLAHWGDWRGNLNGRIPVDWPPELLLPSGFQLRTLTEGIQAGDQFGAWQMMLEEWFED